MSQSAVSQSVTIPAVPEQVRKAREFDMRAPVGWQDRATCDVAHERDQFLDLHARIPYSGIREDCHRHRVPTPE